MAYVIECEGVCFDGTLKRWVVCEPHRAERIRTFTSPDAAAKVVRKYRAWSKCWPGKYSYRVREYVGC